MKILRFLLQKEFRQIFRDKTIIAMMFMMPTVQLIILPLAMDLEVKNISLSIVDRDHSSYSQQLISKVGSSGYFKMVSMEPSYKEALKYVERDEADVVLEIPAGFERNLIREGKQKVGLSVDAIDGTKASIGGSYLNAIIADFTANLEINNKATTPTNYTSKSFIDVTYSTWFNPLAQFKYYLVPGILVLLLTMIGGFLSSLNIVREKEVGTIEQINVSPIKKWQFILGKLIPFWIMGIIVFTLGLVVCWLIYGIVSEGSLLLLYLFAAFYLIAVLGFGLLISTISDNQIQAMFLAFFFMMIFTLMGGLFTSVESMPDWARNISNLMPITHFIRVVRMVMLKGSGFADVQLEFFYIIVFGVILNGWAIWNYRKTA
ncbi:ABC transporter permease [Albibacterium bauzanense]|uniref:ABC-2 type transport system permease protein n=1 Tax=Albibacterium bauzanense TaxID=653929 RepID=A0A4R1M0J6_9SPHI|nr:ABC transporter permease [Albibacterium bauzanense]TCK84732.1 ABC-2 type transport system permease protein [Albibacterium bauzanense]